MVKIKLNTIRFKLSFIVFVLTFIYSVILLSYFNYRYKDTMLEDAINESEVLAQSYAREIKSQIESALDISRTVAQIFSSKLNTQYQIQLSRNDASLIIRNLVEKNYFLLGMYTAWEPDKFDGLDSEFAGMPLNHPKGHFVPYWYKNSDGKIGYEPLKYYLVPGKGDYYLQPKASKRETVIDPIIYKIGDREVLLMTLVVPILSPNEDFVGIVGTDISSESIQKLVDESRLFDGTGELSIVSNNGTLVAASVNKEQIGKNIHDISPAIEAEISKNSLLHSVIQNDTLKTFVPISFGTTATPWYVVIQVPVMHLTMGVTWELVKLTIFGLIFLILLVTATSYAIQKLLNPLQKITNVAQLVATGDLQVDEVHSNSAEIEELNEAFKKVIESQKDITNVTRAIAAGDYSKTAEIKSDKDQMASAVNQMISYLKTSAQEDNKRKWSNEGYARFAELLREENDLKKLCNTALTYLIKYTDANQGGLFIVNGEGDNLHLALTGSYAYGRVKYNEQKIYPGQGLVGQVYVEKETVLLTDVPKDYVAITSGLGEALPDCIIIVPLINNEKIEGVLEIASFGVLESYKIEFLEKCAISLASIISNTRINELTSKLLAEAQDQAEQMKMQEEEMRQNMEELAATQEEMQRKEKEYLKVIEELKSK